MNQNRLKPSSIFLMLGVILLVIAFSAENTTFTWLAIAFMLVGLVMSGKWLRPRKK
jgi:membrane protein implicated in regulation of membrane protease activity